jgi:hypothetical protein
MRGRPTEYDNIDSLITAVESYFDKCEPEPMYYDLDGEKHIATDKNGKAIIIEHPATMAGLAYHLGYSSRQAIYDLEHKSEDFSYVIKRARLRVEADHESNLSTRDKCTGDIFWLKNHPLFCPFRFFYYIVYFSCYLRLLF